MKAVEESYLKADLLAVLIGRHYEPMHGPSMASVGNCPKWDLKFSDNTTAEIKFDGKASKTGNVAVEFWDLARDAPSGITRTEAQLWIHCISERGKLRVFEINTRALLRLCIETGDVKECSNGNSSLIKLIRVDEIRRIANQEFLLEGALVDLVSSQEGQSIGV